MSNPLVFIPPEGAMQFALDREKLKKDNRPFPRAKFQDVIWVLPPISNRMPCDCKLSFPILLDSLTPENRATALKYLGRNSRMILCTCRCQGEVIE